jgi:aminoglycoside phosphotransferase (APT) family kinase protein
LLAQEFPQEEVFSIERVPNALSTVVYEVKTASKAYIVKIGIDKTDIERKKGEKEKRALELATEALGDVLTPRLLHYFSSYQDIPGYVIFLERLPGEVMPAQRFNEVASSKENLDILTNALLELHSHKQQRFSDLYPGTTEDFSAYLVNTHIQIKDKLTEAGLVDRLASQLGKLEQSFAYFDGYHDFNLIHGDINFKNLLVSGAKISALIDWDRAMISPVAFEFAHVSTLTEKYGVSSWHKKLMANYWDKYTGDGDKLMREFKLIELFIYFKLLARKLTHVQQKDAVEICVETGEELKDYFIRKILEHS